MRLAFVVNHVTGGWGPYDTRLGGTEESVVRWSEELVKLGYHVGVYSNGFIGECNGVTYGDRSTYAGGYDATINIKSSDIGPFGSTLYLTNETNASELDLSAYDGVIWPSRWAADNIPVNNPTVFVLPHGYDATEIYPGPKMSHSVLYASSPDRGLDTLLEVWPMVLEQVPDAVLTVTYGAAYREIENVIFLGELNEAEMNTLYRSTDVWCHPCNGGELFGITAVKAQAAGCVPVYFPTMALSETVRRGRVTERENLVSDLVDVLMDDLYKDKVRAELAMEHFPDWAETAVGLLRIVAKNLPKSHN